MVDLTPDVIARFVTDDFFAANATPAPDGGRRDLAARVETALRAAIRAERVAIATLCDKRAKLWADAEGKSRIPEHARVEARARSNEAPFIADAVREGRP